MNVHSFFLSVQQDGNAAFQFFWFKESEKRKRETNTATTVKVQAESTQIMDYRPICFFLLPENWCMRMRQCLLFMYLLTNCTKCEVLLHTMWIHSFTQHIDSYKYSVTTHKRKYSHTHTHTHTKRAQLFNNSRSMGMCECLRYARNRKRSDRITRKREFMKIVFSEKSLFSINVYALI